MFTLGDAGFYGSMGGQALNAPAVAIISSTSGRGYLIVGRDGGTFTFGDKAFPGSLSGTRLNAPIVAAARFGTGGGVWLLGADGGIFSLNAPFYGSAAAESNAVPPPVGATVSSPGLVKVACPNGGSITVAASIGRQLTELIADARAAGYTLCGSGYRDASSQIALRRQNCGTTNYAIYEMDSSKCTPPTAKPGTSRHERGLAVDFTATSNGYTWLKNNAPNYGLHLLVSGAERWHFSTDGH